MTKTVVFPPLLPPPIIHTPGATVLLLGQANLGKSTLARFLTNFLLNSYPKVAFLECDVGQAEFTPFGVIALNLVDEPIIGNQPTLDVVVIK